jgi:hypothetical protein
MKRIFTGGGKLHDDMDAWEAATRSVGWTGFNSTRPAITSGV